MGINPRPDAYPDIAGQAVDIESENAQLGQIHREWLQQDDAPNLSEALEEARAGSDPAALLWATRGYLALLVSSSDSEAPIAAYRRAQAAIVNLAPSLSETADAEEAFGRLHDEARAAIDNPLHVLDGEQPENPKPPHTPVPLGTLRGLRQSSDALFGRLAQGDPYAREKLLENYLPLARRLAAKYTDGYANRVHSIDDVTQVASLGLLKALDRFDSSRGIPFGAYAIPTITGEIKRYFRDYTWSLRVPRDLQDRAMAVKKIINEAAEFGRESTAEEIAESLGITKEQALEARSVLQQGGLNARSLDEPEWQEDRRQTVTPQDSLADPEAEAAYDRQAEHADLIAAIKHLPAELRTVVTAYYWGELSQDEIGRLMHVSQMHISRRKRAAIGQLTILLDHDQA